jgi:hypothetical protein
VLLSLALSLVAAGPISSERPVWISDQGDGTYRNPVIHADYSDPDVIRVGGGD